MLWHFNIFLLKRVQLTLFLFCFKSTLCRCRPTLFRSSVGNKLKHYVILYKHQEPIRSDPVIWDSTDTWKRSSAFFPLAFVTLKGSKGCIVQESNSYNLWKILFDISIPWRSHFRTEINQKVQCWNHDKILKSEVLS